MEWFGLESTIEDQLVHCPAMDRDIFHWIRLLKAPINLQKRVFKYQFLYL